MEDQGSFIRLNQWLKAKKYTTRGQIATFIVLFIAIVFLLTAVTINIARVSQKKITVMNAAAGASLSLASGLGSYAHNLSATYLKNQYRVEGEVNGWRIFEIITLPVFIITGIIFLFLPGAQSAGVALLGMSYEFSKGLYLDSKALDAMQKNLKNLSFPDKLSEGALQYAFMNTVDDQARVIDLYDFDMDGKTDNLISRFFYKYTLRQVWLSSDNYEENVQALIDGFRPSITRFNEACKGLLDYIRPIPTATQPVTLIPKFWDMLNAPQKINNLYSLFAYLHEQERRFTGNDIYNLRLAGRNIWTNGIKVSIKGRGDPGEYNLDPNSFNNSQGYCWAVFDPLSPENDELDILAYDLFDFTKPSEEYYEARGDRQIYVGGFAAYVIEGMYGPGFEDWFPKLYSEDGKDDYYHRIWDSPDDSGALINNTGWDYLVTWWLNKLKTVDFDLKARILEKKCKPDDIPCHKEKERLGKLKEKVVEAVNKLTIFKKNILDFRIAIEKLRDDIKTLDSGLGILPEDAQGDDLLFYRKNNPEYVWTDSLGRHSVKVQVAPFTPAGLKTYRRHWYESPTSELTNADGDAVITVTRTDGPTDAKFSGRAGLLWKFKYPALSYKSTSSWDWRENPPVLLSVVKNEN